MTTRPMYIKVKLTHKFQENYFSYNFTHRKPPERGADNSIKQIGKIKRLLKRLQDANTETDHEPSCLVLDPSM